MEYATDIIMLEETTEDIKQVLIGIQLNPYNTKPIFEFDRWGVYAIPANKIIVDNHYHRNYQINRNDTEKIVIRTWLNRNLEITKIRYYYLKTKDAELAGYLVKILIKRISSKYPISESITLKDISKL